LVALLPHKNTWVIVTAIEVPKGRVTPDIHLVLFPKKLKNYHQINGIILLDAFGAHLYTHQYRKAANYIKQETGTNNPLLLQPCFSSILYICHPTFASHQL